MSRYASAPMRKNIGKVTNSPSPQGMMLAATSRPTTSASAAAFHRSRFMASMLRETAFPTVSPSATSA